MQKDLFIFSAGLIVTALSVTSPASVFWSWAIWAGVCAMLLSAAHSIISRLLQRKGLKLDPFLMTSIAGSLIAAIFLIAYALRQSPVTNANAPSSSTGQPEISLLAPKERYSFKWDPTKAMYFDIQREGSPLPSGHTANPGFILHNASAIAAADVVVTWQAQISGIKKLAKLGVASKYQIVFTDESTMDLISPPSPPVPNFRYYFSTTSEAKLPFVARNADIFLPINMYPLLGLFIAAKMPSELGAATEAFPIRIDVSWSVPDGGQPRSFYLKIRGVNTRPSGVTGPPEVIGYLDFEIEQQHAAKR